MQPPGLTQRRCLSAPAERWPRLPAQSPVPEQPTRLSRQSLANPVGPLCQLFQAQVKQGTVLSRRVLLISMTASPGGRADDSSASSERNGPLFAALAAVLVLVVLPLYALALYFLIRSHVFSGGNITDNQYKAVFTFVGTGLTASVTLVGLVLTWTHNSRLRRQQAFDNAQARRQEAFDNAQARRQQELDREQVKLETVVKGLEQVAQGDEYAVPGRIGGALAALVQLGHPITAMRVLDAAWEDDVVHCRTACWVIGKILNLPDEYTAKESLENSVVEAAELLACNAGKLAYEAGRYRACYWPKAITYRLPPNLPREAQVTILIALTRVILSKSAVWWEDRYAWAIVLLDQIQQMKGDRIPRSAGFLLGPLVRVFERTSKKVYDEIAETDIFTKDIKVRIAGHGPGPLLGELAKFEDELLLWAQPESSYVI